MKAFFRLGLAHSLCATALCITVPAISKEIESASPAELNNAGTHCMAKGRYQAAIDYFSKALFLDPAYDLALLNRGLAKEKLADYDGAITDLSKAWADKSGESAFALDSRARIELHAGRYQSALDDYTHLIQLFPQAQSQVSYYHGRALAKKQLNDKIGAHEDFEKEKRLRHELKANKHRAQVTESP